MAVQVHAAYPGQSFTPGGSPWYEHAVDYAMDNGILLRGEFSDYAAPCHPGGDGGPLRLRPAGQ